MISSMGVLPTPGPPRLDRAGWKRRFSVDALRDVDGPATGCSTGGGGGAGAGTLRGINGQVAFDVRRVNRRASVARAGPY